MTKWLDIRLVIFEGLFSTWQSSKPTLAIFYAIGQTLIVENGQMLNKQACHLVTLSWTVWFELKTTHSSLPSSNHLKQERHRVYYSASDASDGPIHPHESEQQTSKGWERMETVKKQKKETVEKQWTHDIAEEYKNVWTVHSKGPPSNALLWVGN